MDNHKEFAFVSGLTSRSIANQSQDESIRKSHAAKATHRARRARKEAQKALESVPLPLRRLAPNPRIQLRTISPVKSTATARSTETAPSCVEDGLEDEKRRTSTTINEVTVVKRPLVHQRSVSTIRSIWFCTAAQNFKPEERRTFALWWERSIPFFVRGTEYQDPFRMAISTCYSESIAVRHMILCQAMMHERLLIAQTPEQGPPLFKAIRHYQQGLSEMMKQNSLMEKLIAALVAASIEAIQLNHTAEKIHLTGIKALLYEGRDDPNTSDPGTKDLNRKVLFPLFSRICSVATINWINAKTAEEEKDKFLLYRSHKFILASYTSIQEARELIIKIVHAIQEVSLQHDFAEYFAGIRAALQVWFSNHKFWMASSTDSANSACLDVFLQLALAILPTEISSGMSCGFDPWIKVQLWRTIEQKIDQYLEVPLPARENVYETLGAIVNLVYQIEHGDKTFRQKAQAALDRITIQKAKIKELLNNSSF